MLRLVDGILVIDSEDYSSVDISNMDPDRTIVLEVLGGSVWVAWPLDREISQGETVDFSVNSYSNYIRLTKYSSEDALILLKYFNEEPPPSDCEVSYDMEAIVPIAVSSELSHTGEERIHMAPAIELPPPPPIPEHRMSVELVYMYPSGEA